MSKFKSCCWFVQQPINKNHMTLRHHVQQIQGLKDETNKRSQNHWLPAWYLMMGHASLPMLKCIYIYHTTYKNIYIICIVWDPQEQTIQVSNVKGCEVIKNAKLGHTVHPIMRYITSWRLFTIPRIIPRLPLPQQSSWSEQYYLQTTKIINIRISDTVCSIAWFYPFIDMIQSTVWGQTQNHPVISHFVP